MTTTDWTAHMLAFSTTPVTLLEEEFPFKPGEEITYPPTRLGVIVQADDHAGSPDRRRYKISHPQYYTLIGPSSANFEPWMLSLTTTACYFSLETLNEEIDPGDYTVRNEYLSASHSIAAQWCQVRKVFLPFSAQCIRRVELHLVSHPTARFDNQAAAHPLWAFTGAAHQLLAALAAGQGELTKLVE